MVQRDPYAGMTGSQRAIRRDVERQVEENRKTELWNNRPRTPFDPEKFREDVLKSQLSLDQFRTAVRAGAFRRVRLTAGGEYFEIAGMPQTVRPTSASSGEWLYLATTRTWTRRRFRSVNAALELLYSIGAMSVEVHLSNWHPENVKECLPKRPDMSARLKEGHRLARERDGMGEFSGGSDGERRPEGDFDWEG